MDLLSHLVLGFGIALEPINLLYAFLGAVLGTLVGVLPGIGPTATIALLVPASVALPKATAIIMLCGVYYGSMYGGSTTAILINTPGEAASVITALDGYALCRQGRAGAALGMAAVASFVAGTLGVVGLMLIAPPLADFALSFGPPEQFALMCFGLTIIVSLAGKSLAKGAATALLGMLLGTVGLDPIGGHGRFDFGNPDLLSGFDFVAVIVGLFAITEVLTGLEEQYAAVVTGKLRGLWPTMNDWRRSLGALWRGSAIGFFVGVLPGASASVASFIAYDVEKKVSREPERFGHGAIEGVAAPEGANNAAVAGGMVPLLTLGLPPSAPLAVLLSALMLHGVRPGPLFFQQHADVAWALIASMYIGNVMLLVLNLPLVGFWAQLARIPYPILAPAIVVFCFIGAYGVRNNPFDVWVALGMGLLGWLMRKLEFPAVPLVIALILSPMLEAAFRQSLSMSRGDPTVLVSRPIALVLLAAAVASLLLSLWGRRRRAPVTAVLGVETD